MGVEEGGDASIGSYTGMAISGLVLLHRGWTAQLQYGGFRKCYGVFLSYLPLGSGFAVDRFFWHIITSSGIS